MSIGFDGSQMVGDEIRDQLSAIFDDHVTATYIARVSATRSLGPDAAVLRAIVGMVPRAAAPSVACVGLRPTNSTLGVAG